MDASTQCPVKASSHSPLGPVCQLFPAKTLPISASNSAATLPCSHFVPIMQSLPPLLSFPPLPFILDLLTRQSWATEAPKDK